LVESMPFDRRIAG